MSIQLDPLVLGTIALPNFTANGSIGTAATTVNVAPCFTIAQTTANISLTLPIPLNPASGRIITIINIGTVRVTVNGSVIFAARYRQFIYHNATWYSHST